MPWECQYQLECQIQAQYKCWTLLYTADMQLLVHNLVSWVTTLILVCPVCQGLSAWQNSDVKFLPKILKQTQLLWFFNILYFDGFLPEALKNVFISRIYLIPCYINWFLYRNKLKMHLYQFSFVCFRLHRKILKCQEKYHVVCCTQLQRDMEHAPRLCQGKVTMVNSWWANVCL